MCVGKWYTYVYKNRSCLFWVLNYNRKNLKNFLELREFQKKGVCIRWRGWGKIWRGKLVWEVQPSPSSPTVSLRSTKGNPQEDGLTVQALCVGMEVRGTQQISIILQQQIQANLSFTLSQNKGSRSPFWRREDLPPRPWQLRGWVKMPKGRKAPNTDLKLGDIYSPKVGNHFKKEMLQYRLSFMAMA